MKTKTLAPPSNSLAYHHPDQVLRCEVLDQDGKRLVLGAWLEDERALFRADDDGMVGGAPARTDEIVAALQALASEGPRPQTPHPILGCHKGDRRED